MEIKAIYELLVEAGMQLSTDTRTIAPGAIYVGLKGEHFDGNAYAHEALEKGARYAIIDNPSYREDDRCIVVENSYDALKELAKLHRQSFSIPLLVIGGSNGKTTTKELTAAVLGKKYKVHVTKGNLNNDIGVPLTLLAMPADTEIAIIEIGANHPGEHTVLMDIVRPTHVLVTNNGADHLEGFGSLEGVRKANKEVFDCARDLKATAFVNKTLADLVEDSEGLNRVLYPEDIFQSTSDLYAGVVYEDTAITSHLFGAFNEANILAAIAIGKSFQVPMADIANAMADYQPTLKRSQIIQKDDYTIVLDCYNANPTSMTLALNDFLRSSAPNQRIIVVGDMFEVGETEAEAHKEILELIQQQRDADDVVICVGPRFSAHKEAFPDFYFFPSPTDAKPFFEQLPHSGKTIFLKASRGIKLEGILE